jgi:hypothetical protein
MKFTTKYERMVVWCDNAPLQFINGEYETKNKKEISVLKSLNDINYQEEKPTQTPLEEIIK